MNGIIMAVGLVSVCPLLFCVCFFFFLITMQLLDVTSRCYTSLSTFALWLFYAAALAAPPSTSRPLLATFCQTVIG